MPDHRHDDPEQPGGCSDPAGCGATRLGSNRYAICRTGHVRSTRHRLQTKMAPSFDEAIFVCMARPARFERATAWFVARYSIQLSYGRVRGRTIGMSCGQVKAAPALNTLRLAPLKPLFSISFTESGQARPAPFQSRANPAREGPGNTPNSPWNPAQFTDPRSAENVCEVCSA